MHVNWFYPPPHKDQPKSALISSRTLLGMKKFAVETLELRVFFPLCGRDKPELPG